MARNIHDKVYTYCYVNCRDRSEKYVLVRILIFSTAHILSFENVCDIVFKQSHNKGIGTDMKATPVQSDNEEIPFGKGRYQYR